MAIKLYEVNPNYIDYLVPYAPHLFHNKQPGQHNERKYIGIVLSIKTMNYFAPLSSFKPKHEKMKNGLDFIKVGNYAVININNMFPVPDGEYTYVDIPGVKDLQYRKLLEAEYRIIRKSQDKIRDQAAEVYKHKMNQGNATALAKRCNDFLVLEEKCRQFMSDKIRRENTIADNIFEQVEKNIDNLVDSSVDWSACASREQLQAAKAGKLKLQFFDRDVPEEWLKDIRGKKVLCLAGAGGLQAPLLACAGAQVTVIDISNKMLDKDRGIARRENLQIEIVKGNICDLSMFDDGQFEVIINPPSLMYIPDLSVVFRECHRVLARGGTFLIMAPNPINYVCDYIDDENGGYYKAVHKMPFCSKDYDDTGWIEYGHTMEAYLGGLIECGFCINGYMECQMEDITELHFMVRAIKRVAENGGRREWGKDKICSLNFSKH